MADHYESDSDDIDESLTVPKGPEEVSILCLLSDILLLIQLCRQDDPIIEYQDEFGRMRSAKRSEVPREYMQTQESSTLDDDEYVLFHLTNHLITHSSR
jgi:hypothetical protein